MAFPRCAAMVCTGYETYLAVTLSNEHSRTVTLEKYKDLLRGNAVRVGYFAVENPYTDGAVLMLFLHDDFGREVRAVLASKEQTFRAAMNSELGVTPEQPRGALETLAAQGSRFKVINDQQGALERAA